METNRIARTLRRVFPAAALLLAVLRTLTLKLALDENGLLPRGSLVLPLTVLLAALVFGGLWLLCLGLNRLPGREDCFTRRPLWQGLLATAGALVLLGGLLSLLDGRTELLPAERAIHAGGVLSGLLLALIALRPERGRGFFWARLIPALYTGAALVLRFQDWSHDPLVIHIAPMVLAWTCCMVEMMLLTGFPLDAGHRRSGVLFGLAAGCFACMTLPDYLFGLRSGLPELLTLLGLSLWSLLAGLELLRRRPQSELPPSPPEEAETPPLSENEPV